MQALVRAPAPAPSVPAPPESPRQADEERNRERNRGYARAYRERKRLKLQTLENCRQELLKDNARLLEEAQARDRKEAALSAERDAARDRLARVEAENARAAGLDPPAQRAAGADGAQATDDGHGRRPRAPRRRTRQRVGEEEEVQEKSRAPNALPGRPPNTNKPCCKCRGGGAEPSVLGASDGPGPGATRPSKSCWRPSTRGSGSGKSRRATRCDTTRRSTRRSLR